MGFEDLDEAAGEQSADNELDAETTTESDIGSDQEQADPHTEPAFAFVQGKMQANVYAREATREEWEETQKFEVDRLLHEHGIKNVAGREHHDAMFRLAADHPKLWARYIMEARDLDVPDDFDDE